jgi:hypothetical protein
MGRIVEVKSVLGSDDANALLAEGWDLFAVVPKPSAASGGGWGPMFVMVRREESEAK